MVMDANINVSDTAPDWEIDAIGDYLSSRFQYFQILPSRVVGPWLACELREPALEAECTTFDRLTGMLAESWAQRPVDRIERARDALIECDQGWIVLWHLAEHFKVLVAAGNSARLIVNPLRQGMSLAQVLERNEWWQWQILQRASTVICAILKKEIPEFRETVIKRAVVLAEISVATGLSVPVLSPNILKYAAQMEQKVNAYIDAWGAQEYLTSVEFLASKIGVAEARKMKPAFDKQIFRCKNRPDNYRIPGNRGSKNVPQKAHRYLRTFLEEIFREI